MKRKCPKCGSTVTTYYDANLAVCLDCEHKAAFKMFKRMQ